MKFFKALAATACALALATAAHAATYTDSSANYPDGWSSGSNGGSGFGAWTLASSGNSWSGIWPLSEAGLKQGVWADKENAFAFVARGDNSSFTASRSFRAALAPGDSFSLEMGVNYDGDRVGSTKGFALTANGETIVTVNHEFDTDWTKSGWISINGENTGSDILNTYGTFPMTWTFTAKDATTLSVTATARDDSSKVYTADLTVATSAIDGFVLQSAQQTSDDVKERQTYFDNFVLDIAAELPDLVTLHFDSGDWNVTSSNQDVKYTLSRSSSVGDLTVNVKSSYEAFIPSFTISFADGESTATGTTTATLQPYAFNTANLTATATGCDSDTFQNIRGPKFDREVKDGQWEFMPNDSATFWMHWYWDGFDVDYTKVTLSCEPADAVVLPASLEWNLVDEVGDDGVKAWLESSFTVVSSGKILFQYDGVTFDDWDVTVKTIGFELSGPTSVKTDATATYTLKATLDGAEEGCNVTVAPSKGVTVDPVSFDLVDEKDGFYSQDIEITFATAGDYTISVASANYSASLDVSVSEPADFSGYIAYDDGSLYADDFDATATGEGTDKFQAWDIVTKNSGDIFLAHSAPDASVLTDGAAFGIWANGADNAELQARRPFVNSLGDGQAFSVVLSPNWRAGTKGMKFMGYDADVTHEWWQRAEFFYNEDGYFYKLEGNEEATLIWDAFSTDAITVTLQKAADGSSYTLTFARGDDVVAKEDITSFGGTVDAVQFYSYQGGEGDEQNFVFNKLAIEQVEEPVEPVVKRNIGIMGIWNPDATGDYDFYVGPSEAGDEAIGTVNLTVTPDDGRITISPASVEVPGDDVAAFKVKVNSLPAAGEETVRYTIKATPENELVNPATFDVTPAQPYVYLSSDNNQLTTDDGPVGLVLHASPARYGEYRITTDDDSVFSIPENYQTVTLSEEQPEATFFVDIVGPSGENGASIYATLGEGEAWCDYRFWVSEGSDDPYADILLITAMDKADPNMVLTVDGTPATAYGATEIVGGDWAWQPLDDATIAGDKVTVPMTGRPYLIIKVEK